MEHSVVQHCFGAPHAGGPATALKRLQASRAQPYPQIWQHEAAGGLSIPLLRHFIGELRRLRPRLLHVRGLGNEGFHAALAGRLARVPHILVSVHGTHRDLGGDGGLRRSVVVNLLEPATLRMADSVITVCRSAEQRDFIQPFRHKLLPPVPNGVPVPDFDEVTRGAVRTQLGIGPDRIVAVIVSRLTEQKGYIELAGAMRRIEASATSPGIDLIVVGGGDDDGSIAQLFAGLEKCYVNFVGQQTDVSPYLMAADMFVLPSWLEQLSNALLEAMAHGLPALATPVGGTPEVLEHGGGMLIPVRDPDALANAMMKLAGDAKLRGNLGRAARQTVVEHYSLERMVQSWEDRYRTILEDRKRPGL